MQRSAHSRLGRLQSRLACAPADAERSALAAIRMNSSTHFILASVLVLAQSGPALMSERRLQGPCDDCLHGVQEGFLDIRDIAGPNGRAVFRICSKEPLVVAVAVATRDPVQLAGYLLEDYPQFSADRIFIARQATCPRPFAAYTPLEMWGVPPGASLPAADEQVSLTQLHLTDFAPEERRTAAAQDRALRTLANELRARPKAVAVLKGYYWGRPTAVMRRNLRLAAAALAREGTDKGRIYSRLVPAQNSGWREQSHFKYPDLYAVEITER
jgi:hypothetical protein